MLTTLDRLTFGRKVPDGSFVEADDWARFEARHVAPAFPAGYTVIHAEGAWRDEATGEPVHEPATIIEVAHDGSEESVKALLAVARVYKALYRQDAVMRSTSPVRVDFI